MGYALIAQQAKKIGIHGKSGKGVTANDGLSIFPNFLRCPSVEKPQRLRRGLGAVVHLGRRRRGGSAGKKKRPVRQDLGSRPYLPSGNPGGGRRISNRAVPEILHPAGNNPELGEPGLLRSLYPPDDRPSFGRHRPLTVRLPSWEAFFSLRPPPCLNLERTLLRLYFTMKCCVFWLILGRCTQNSAQHIG